MRFFRNTTVLQSIWLKYTETMTERDLTKDQFIRSIEIHWEEIPENSYLREIDALHNVTEVSFRSPVTVFTGENGSGKSTLLEAVAENAGFNAEGGSKNYSFSTYNAHSALQEYSSLIRGGRREKWGYFLRAESFFNVATQEEEYTRIGGVQSAEYHSMSHGESFLGLAVDKFENRGLYLLDEPEAALSVQRQMALLSVIHRSVQNGSQFMIVTHSPILMGYPDAEILTFDDGPIHPIAWEDTDSYRLTKLFLNYRERILQDLFAEE